MDSRRKIISAIAGLSLVAGLLVVWSGLVGRDEPSTVIEPASAGRHRAEPGEREFYEAAFAFAGNDRPVEGRNAVAGVVPHHLLAADLIADFFQGLAGEDCELVVLVGPNHFLTGRSEIVTSDLDWETPYGILEPDRSVIAELEASGTVQVESGAMVGEHAISGEVSFIKRTFPDAKILPLILRPSVDEVEAEALARALHEIAGRHRTVVIASTDFSHYETSEVAQMQDRESLAVLGGIDYRRVYGMAVDSPPTIYAVMRFSELSGARFEMRRNSNSAILSGQPDIESTTSYVTGWFVAN